VTTIHDHDTAAQPTAELPPFVFVPDRSGTGAAAAPVEVAQPPAVDGSGRVRRWSRGHSVAAAVVAVGVLASGGAALAARDAGTTGVPGAPGGVVPAGPLPGGQLPGQQQPQPGQLGGRFGGHDDDLPGGQPPG
jgi:hypothetical protein